MQLSTRIADAGWRRQLPDALVLCRRAVAAALDEAVAGSADGEISLLLTNDREMARLNGEWRGRHRPTNVLSFPVSGDGAGGGDVALGLGTVEREAEAGGKSIADHATHLIVHGVLHLFGYDHDDCDAARIMERREAAALARLGIPDPYAPATEPETRP